MSSNRALLEVRDLRTYFDTDDGLVKAVDGVNFCIDRGQTFALVGESGCGKSVTSFSILRLLPSPPARIESGQILFNGQDLVALPEKEMRKVRGGQISMIFQEPMTSLNPVYTCGNQIVEGIRLHRNVTARQAKTLAIDMLAKVGIPEPVQRFDEYPHQLSGGMRQRVMIAMALACHAKLLIADEPTTALDVTIQAQILDLLNELQREQELGILLITHDLAVVAETADKVAVMYASKLVELADKKTLFSNPLHPYTHGLFRSVPRLGTRHERLETIPGSVPVPLRFPPGCKFHPRCMRTRQLAAQADGNETTEVVIGQGSVRVLKRCAAQEPEMREVQSGHCCACWEVAGYAEASPQCEGKAAVVK